MSINKIFYPFVITNVFSLQISSVPSMHGFRVWPFLFTQKQYRQWHILIWMSFFSVQFYPKIDAKTRLLNKQTDNLFFAIDFLEDYDHFYILHTFKFCKINRSGHFVFCMDLDELF